MAEHQPGTSENVASIPSTRKRTEEEKKEREREIYVILVVENSPSMESSVVMLLPAGSCFDFQ